MTFKTRYHLLLPILIFYFVPLFTLGLYKASNLSEITWNFFAAALLISSFGTLCLFLILKNWQESLISDILPENLQRNVHAAPLRHQELQEAKSRLLQLEAQMAEEDLQRELLHKELESRILDVKALSEQKEDLQKRIVELSDELHHLKEAAEEKLEQNQIFLHEHQQTIAEQRHTLEIKQQHIQQLEDKVRDLTYEIKTLLNIAEKAQQKCQDEIGVKEDNFLLLTPNSDEGSFRHFGGGTIRNEGAAFAQLKRCVDIAQKMTGASHYMSRQSKLPPIDHYALDLRRLFDSLRSENSCTVLVYSQKENKPIFVNPQIKTLLGWTSDKFLLHFPSIMSESSEIWLHSLSQLAYKNECQVDLMMKARTGALMSIKCHLGIVPTGLFRSHIIGILYMNQDDKLQ